MAASGLAKQLSLDLAVVGPHHGASGKSCLICGFVAGYFQDIVQLDTAQLFRTVAIHGKTVNLRIAEVMRGELDYDTIMYGLRFLNRADGIMHVYNTTECDAREFLRDAERDLLRLEDERTRVHMLVGTCCDLEAERRVSQEQGREWAVSCDWLESCFMEVSAKTGLNVDRAFYTLARDCLIKQNLLDKRVALQQVPRYQARLTDACESGDFESVLDLLSEGCNPNCMGYTTPLHCACQHNLPLEAIKQLLKHCNPAERDWYGNTPLHIASQLGHIDTVKYLVNEGHCNPCATNIDGQNCLHLVCKVHHEKVVQCRMKDRACDVDVSGRDCPHWVCQSCLLSVLKYLTRYCNPNDKDSNGKNCLHHACEAGCEYLVDYLLSETECSIEKGSDLGSECLRQACSFGFLNMVKYLVSERNYNPNCYTGDRSGRLRNYLHIACGRGHLEVVKYLASVMPCGPRCLHIACEAGCVEIVEYLVIERQCDPNVYVRDNYCGNEFNCLQRACSHNRADVVKFLISQPQCDVKKTDYPVGNCLFWACKNGHLQIVKYLVTVRHCNPYAAIPSCNFISSDGSVAESESYTRQQQNYVYVAISNAQRDIVEYLLAESECDVSYRDKTGWTYLHWACKVGFLDVVKHLIVNRHCNPNDKDVNGQNCLQIAFSAGLKNVVKYSLDETECSAMDRGARGRNWLHKACKVGDIDVLKYLINDGGCNPNYPDAKGQNCLHIASNANRTDIVEFLVGGNHCNPNDKDMEGQTCLHLAYKQWNSVTVRYLIRCGTVDVDEKDKSGSNCLLWACKQGHSDIVRYLVVERHCDTTVTNSQGQNCLHIACQEGHSDIVKFLVDGEYCNPNNKDKDGHNSLHTAYCCNNKLIVAYLISVTSPLHCVDEKDRNGSNCLLWACKEGRIDIMRYLITERHCNTTVTNAQDQNCLHIACQKRRIDIVKFLVDGRYCNPNSKDEDGQNSLHTAYCCVQKFQKRHVEIVEYLISVAAPLCCVKVDEKDRNGSNCLLWACEEGRIDIMRYLIHESCDTTVTNPEGQNCLHIACQEGHSDIVKFLVDGEYCNPNNKDKDGHNSLHTAYCCNNKLIVAYLISVTSPLHCVDEKDRNGSNCLLWACKEGCIDIMRYLITERHCNTTVTNAQDQNCLHIACQKRRIDIVKFLVDGRYCNPNSKDEDGQNSLHTAYYCVKNFQKRYIEIVEYLISVAAPLCCVKVDEKDKNGSNCLLWACRAGLIDIMRYLITERHCDTTVTNPQGQNCLHIACQEGHSDIIEFLVCGEHCNPNDKDRKGKTCPQMDYMRNAKDEKLLIVKDLMTVDQKGKHGSYLLWACKQGHSDIVRYLIEKHCSTTTTNPLGQNCLHIACQEGHTDIIEFLVSGEHCNPDDKDKYGQTCLQMAYMGNSNDIQKPEIVKYLMRRMVNVNEKGINGQTCLQWACEEGYISIVEFLICSRHCNVGEYGQKCFQLACSHDNVDIVQALISQGHCDPFVRNEIGSTLLHACESVKVVRYLVEEVGIDPSSTDNLDQTPLHRAVRESHYGVVKYLLSTGRVNIFLQDFHGNTALDLAKTKKVIKRISDAEMKLKHRLVPQKPPEPSVSVFIVGYPSVGKTTLVTALTKEASGLSSLPGFFRKVSADQQTAGIIPTDFVSKVYGRVTFFDLAGQNQYYASHAAVIQNAISSAAPVFLLVVKLPETEEDIKQRIFYWLVFLENQCKQMEAKPHIIIVGSHADRSQAVEEPTRRRIWEYFQTVSCYKSFSLIDFIPLDCRKSESAGVSQLRQRLKTSCDALRREESMEINTHCLFVFLVQKVSAVCISLQQLSEVICLGKLNQGPLQHEDLLQPNHLYHMCSKLHACGHIFFLKNETNPEDSWVIVNKEALLSDITGTIFAPKQFKEHRKDLASSTGVVPFSKLTAHFPDFNTEMIIQFLTHLEFCHEVSDREVVEMINIHERESSRSVPATLTSHNLPSEIPERYFFFPALVSVETPITPLWEEDGQFTYQSGWLIRCSQPEHFFTPRFLQVLLLRLAFSFALAPDSCEFQADLPVLRRKCYIWKNGIYWGSMDGVVSLVEMDRHNRELSIIMRCVNVSKLKCTKRRSAIIHNVLRAMKEFCPKVDTLEYLIHKADIQYPMPQSRELTMFSMNSVAEAILQSLPAVVNDAQKLATIEELLYFEPYADMGEAIVSELFDKQNPSYSTVVSDGFLYTIADRVHPKQSLFEKMLDLPKSSVEFYQSQAPPGSAHAMGHLLVCWKEHGDGSRQCLRQKLDQFSVFAGRSPLYVRLMSAPRPTEREQ